MQTPYEIPLEKKVAALEERVDKLGKPKSAKGIKALEKRVKELEQLSASLEDGIKRNYELFTAPPAAPVPEKE